MSKNVMWQDKPNISLRNDDDNQNGEIIAHHMMVGLKALHHERGDPSGEVIITYDYREAFLSCSSPALTELLYDKLTDFVRGVTISPTSEEGTDKYAELWFGPE